MLTDYEAAIDADNHYQRELERVYKHDACNSRYLQSHKDADVQAASTNAKALALVWINAVRGVK